MPPRTTQIKAVRHRKLASRPTTTAPASACISPAWSPISPQLAQRMDALISLSRQIESLNRGFEFKLFNGPAEQRKTETYMYHLRQKYIALRTQTDNELSALGYLPKSLSIPSLPVYTQNANLTINVQASKDPQTATHKHKYGPTSPHYTVDKALKRKAEKNATPTETRPAKKRKGSAESDYVESDSEGTKVSTGKKKEIVKEEDTSSPPEAITCISMIPLSKKESQKIRQWTWRSAVGKGKGKGKGVVVVESPCGTRATSGW